MTKTTNLNNTCTLQLPKKKYKALESSFENAIIEAVDESFSTYGQSNKQAIYFHLENTFKIEKQEIPYRIEEFVDAIEQIFGAGAKLIKIRIIEALHKGIQDFAHFPKEADLVFTKYVANLRAFLEPQPF